MSGAQYIVSLLLTVAPRPVLVVHCAEESSACVRLVDRLIQFGQNYRVRPEGDAQAAVVLDCSFAPQQVRCAISRQDEPALFEQQRWFSGEDSERKTTLLLLQAIETTRASWAPPASAAAAPDAEESLDKQWVTSVKTTADPPKGGRHVAAEDHEEIKTEASSPALPWPPLAKWQFSVTGGAGFASLATAPIFSIGLGHRFDDRFGLRWATHGAGQNQTLSVSGAPTTMRFFDFSTDVSATFLFLNQAAFWGEVGLGPALHVFSYQLAGNPQRIAATGGGALSLEVGYRLTPWFGLMAAVMGMALFETFSLTDGPQLLVQQAPVAVSVASGARFFF